MAMPGESAAAFVVPCLEHAKPNRDTQDPVKSQIHPWDSSAAEQSWNSSVWSVKVTMFGIPMLTVLLAPNVTAQHHPHFSLHQTPLNCPVPLLNMFATAYINFLHVPGAFYVLSQHQIHFYNLLRFQDLVCHSQAQEKQRYFFFFVAPPVLRHDPPSRPRLMDCLRERTSSQS